MKGKKLLFSLLVAIALVGVMGAPVMAADTQITGIVPAIMELTAPTSFDMPSLDPESTQPVTSTAQTATIKSNQVWQLTVVDSDVSPDGKMALTVTPFTPLTNAMTVTGGDITSAQTLDTARTLEDSGTQGAAQTISDIKFYQTVAWTDEPGEYAITVTFTLSAAP